MNDLSPHSAYANTPPGSPAITAADILLILRRAWYLPVVGCLIGLAMASAYVIFKPPLYKSTARVLIDRSVNRFLQANKILDLPSFDDGETGSQIYVLSSESIVLPIVRSMDLAHDPEFVGNFSNDSAQSSWGIGKLLKRLVGLPTEPPIEPAAAIERTAVEMFLKHLNVSREDVAGVITVTFEFARCEKGGPHSQCDCRFLYRVHFGREIKVYQNGHPTASGPIDGAKSIRFGR